jgi:hypothetical protein
MKATILKVILLATILMQGFCAWHIFSINQKQKGYTEDLVELSKVKYGIFNVDEWKEKLTLILAAKIDEFEIDGENKEEMRPKIEAFLYKAIGEFRSAYRQENNEKVFGFITNFGADIFSIFNRMEKRVPDIADDILNFMEDEENRANLKTWIQNKIDEYTDQTFAETDYSLHNYILVKHNYETRQAAIPGLVSKIEAAKKQKQIYYFITGLLFIVMLTALFSKLGKDKWTIIFTVIYALVLLALGVLLPMIEIDARIAELSFTLLGEPILFTDQILFYKNKSIVEVVGLLMEQGKIDLILVALLVFLFSVLFPLSKLIATVFYILKKETRSLKAAQFLVFKTGKWSMADVMVVAIFMAYIGFSGIVAEQLSQLENISPTIDILTTNESKLNEGFFLFTGFVILSLFISNRMESIKLGMG